MNRSAWWLTLAVVGCAANDTPVDLQRVVAGLEAHPGSPMVGAPEAVEMVSGPDGFRVSVEPLPASGGFWLVEAPMTLELPRLANGPASLTDRKHGASMQWSLAGASEVAGERSGTLVVYRGALDGADVVLRPGRQGVEDFILFARPPREEQVTYQVSLGDGVAGLRLVEGVVEFLDVGGAPRVRIGRAQIVDGAGARHDAEVSLHGCEADTSLAPPWGRRVTPPGSRSCSLSYRWHAEGNRFYPAVFDPPFTLPTKTGSAMNSGRILHRALLLPAGPSAQLVLVCGGWTLYPPDLATGFTPTSNQCEYFNELSRTFATGPTMSAGRAYFVMDRVGNVVVSAGGRTLSGPGGVSLASSQTLNVQNLASGWADAGNMLAPRELAVSFAVEDAGVFVCGGRPNEADPVGSPVCDRWVPGVGWVSAGTYQATNAPILEPASAAIAHTVSYDPVLNRAFIAGGLVDQNLSLKNGSATVYAPTTRTFQGFAYHNDVYQYSAAGFDPISQTHFVAGGLTAGFTLSTSGSPSYELKRYSVSSSGAPGAFVATNSPYPIAFTTPVQLTDGGFLVTGGGSVCCRDPSVFAGVANFAQREAAVLNAGAGTWIAADAGVGYLVVPRAGHTSTRTALGLVALIGGMGDGGAALGSMELYGLLENGTSCDVGARCISEFCVGDTSGINRCCAAGCTQQCAACNSPGAGCVPRSLGSTPRVGCGNFRCNGESLDCPTSCINQDGGVNGNICVPGTECRGGLCQLPDAGSGGGSAGGGAAGGGAAGGGAAGGGAAGGGVAGGGVAGGGAAGGGAAGGGAAGGGA
ncbi:MAG: hypothetical protein Q8S33_02380, partial [Myxococcales bacterium]|nr:hypothetical protein [Myxococcales bacterium]